MKKTTKKVTAEKVTAEKVTAENMIKMYLNGKKIDVVVNYSNNISNRKPDANLLESIRINGIKHPVKVILRPDGKHELIEGFCRSQGGIEHGKKIPCQVVEGISTESEIRRYQYLSNQQKSSAISELAKYIRSLLNMGMDSKEIADELGISVSSVAKALNVSTLSDELANSKTISFGNKVLLAKSKNLIPKLDESDLTLPTNELEKKIKKIRTDSRKPKGKEWEISYKLNEEALLELFRNFGENPVTAKFPIKSEMIKEVYIIDRVLVDKKEGEK